MIPIKQELNYSWWLLRLAYGLTFLGAGIDKFFGLITNWQQFISLSTVLMTGLPLTSIIFAVGVIEIVLGLLIFSRWVKTAALLAAAWMIFNGGYLFYHHLFLDTAARYCTLGIISLAFFHLTRVREKLI